MKSRRTLPGSLCTLPAALLCLLFGIGQSVAANLPPVIGNLNGDIVTFDEGSSGVFLDNGGDATLTDADSPDFNGGSVTVAITANRVPAEDVLGIENAGPDPGVIGISGTNVTFGGVAIGVFVGGSDTNDLVIALNASATPAAVQSLLKAFSYLNAGDLAPTPSVRTVTITVADGDGGSATATVSLQVNALNNPPTLVAPAGIAVVEDMVTAVLGVTVADVDAGTNDVLLTFSAPAGSLSAVAGAGVGVTGSGTGTLRLQGTLSNLNAFVAATNVSFLTATNAATNVLLTVTVNDDGNTGVDPGTSGDGFSEQASTNILLTVTAVNDAPALSVPASIPCYAGGSCPLTGLSGTDVDDAGGAFTLTWSTSGGALQAADGGGVSVTGSGTAGLTLSGTLTALNSFIAASNVVFVTPSNLVSDVTVGLVLNDGGQSGLDPGLTGDSNSEQGSASFTLAVAPGVWAVTVPTNGLYQAGDTLEFTVALSEFVVVDTNGGWPRLVLDIGGTNAFADFADGSGSNVLTFRHSVQAADHDTNGIGVGAAIDLNGGSIVDVSSNSVLITLRNVPSTAGVLVDGAAPTVVNDSFAMSEDTVLNAPSVLANDTDLNGDPLTALLVSGATNGVVTLNADGTFTYRPATNFTGVDAFTYQAGDGWLLSTAATVRLSVDAVNDAPILLCPLALSCPGPGSCALTGIIVGDIDAGVSAARLTITAAAGTLNAVSGSGITVTGGGTTSLVLSGLWSDLNLFLAASSVTFTPPPNPTNDIPLVVTVNDLGNTGADPGSSGDANSEAATATLQMAVPPAVVSVTPPTNGVYVAGEALDFAVTVNKVVIVDTNGGFPRLVLEVGGTNRFAHYLEGSGSNVLTFRYTVQTPDRDADGIGVSTNLDFNGGLIVDLASNALPAMLNGVASTAGVLVDGAAPIVGDDAFTMAEDTVLNGSVLANDSDANGDPLSATLVIGPTNGVVSLSTNGTFTYTPATNFHGLDGFTYKVSDGWVYSGVGTVQVSVTNVNDAPQVSIPIADQAGDYTAPFSFTFPAGTFTDVDGDALTYTATNLPPGITFDGSTRTFSGSPTNGGTFTISVIASDGQTPALTATNMFHFTVGRLMLTATADNVTRSYSAPNPALTISYSGFVNGDTALALTNPPLATTTATNRSPVGTYPITLSGGSDHRYTFVLSNGTLTVTQALLIATAEDKVKENGAPNPALTIAYTGFAAGDNASVLNVPPTASTTASTGSPPGDYPITLSGGSDDNYYLVLAPGTLTIRAAGVPRVRGTFYGLWYQSTEINNYQSGAIVVHTTDGKAFSAVLLNAGRRYPYSGTFDVDGRATNQVARKGDFPVFVEMQLGTANGITQIGGRVTDGFWVADLLANYANYNSRTNPAPQAGNYNMVIQGYDNNSSDPYGHSFASLSITKRGQLSMKLKLSDDNKASGGMFVTAGGLWPCYVPLYKGRGSVLGWLSFSNAPLTDFEGRVNWTKPITTDKTYPLGFAIQIPSYGTRYTPPKSGVRLIDLPFCTLTFSQGPIFIDEVVKLELTTSNKMKDLFGALLPIHIKTKSGMFSGTFLNPFTAAPIDFTALMLQKTNVGVGFFTGGGFSGRVTLYP